MHETKFGLMTETKLSPNAELKESSTQKWKFLIYFKKNKDIFN